MPVTPTYITVPPQTFVPSSYGANISAILQSQIIGTAGTAGVIGYLNNQVQSYYNLSLFYQNNISQLTTVLQDVSGGDNTGLQVKGFSFITQDGTAYLPGSLPSWAFQTTAETFTAVNGGSGKGNDTYVPTVSNPQAFFSAAGGGPYAYGPPPGGTGTIGTSFASMQVVEYYAALYGATFIGNSLYGSSVALNYNSQSVNQQISVQQNYLQNEQTFLNSTVNLIETNISLAGQIVQSIGQVMEAILSNTR